MKSRMLIAATLAMIEHPELLIAADRGGDEQSLPKPDPVKDAEALARMKKSYPHLFKKDSEKSA